jgi:hypothetical protein
MNDYLVFPCSKEVQFLTIMTIDVQGDRPRDCYSQRIQQWHKLELLADQLIARNGCIAVLMQVNHIVPGTMA